MLKGREKDFFRSFLKEKFLSDQNINDISCQFAEDENFKKQAAIPYNFPTREHHC